MSSHLQVLGRQTRPEEAHVRLLDRLLRCIGILLTHNKSQESSSSSISPTFTSPALCSPTAGTREPLESLRPHSMSQILGVNMSASTGVSPPPAFIEFHLFVENFHAPTGRILSQTMLRVIGRVIFRKSQQFLLYNAHKLLCCLPWTKDLLSSLAPTAFVLSLNASIIQIGYFALPHELKSRLQE